MKPAAIALAAMLAGCAPVDEKAPTPDLDSLAMQVKTELINAQPLAAAAVQVQQRDGRIFLTGFADNQTQKQELERIARRAAAGRTVVNELKIK